MPDFPVSSSSTVAAYEAYAVTKSDTVNLAKPCRAVTIGGSGVIRFMGLDGVSYTTGALPA